MNIAKWLDSDRFLHTQKNPSVDQSENGPMFSGLLSIFRSKTCDLPMMGEIWDWKSSWRANSYRDRGSHFSHDNMTGAYCLYKNHVGVVPSSLPIAKWNGRWWLHPRDLTFYLWCHHAILGLPFLWIASLAMIISCIQKYKVRDGKKFIKTDGKLLAYLRCRSFDMPITFAICSFFIRKHKYFNNWNDVAKRYFKEEGHPLRSLIK